MNDRRLLTPWNARPARVATALVATSALVLLAGCGSRLTTEEVRAGGATSNQAAPGSAVGSTTGGVSTEPGAVSSTTGGIVPSTTGGAVSATTGGAVSSTTGGAVAGTTGSASSTTGSTSSTTGSRASTTGSTASAANIKGSAIFGGSNACSPATGSPVKLGNVSTLSGVLGELFSPVVPGLQTFVKSQNACGGLNGHKIELVLGDDQGDPSTAVTVAQRQIQNDKILAFVGNIQVLTVDAMVDVVNKSGIPIIGSDITNNTWYTQPLMFPQGAPPQAISYGYVEAGLNYHHSKKLGDVYCLEVPQACQQIDRAFKELAPKLGAQSLVNTQVSITSPSYTSQCQKFKDAGVEVLAMTFDAASMKRFAKSCKSVSYTPKWMGYPLGVGNEKQFLGEPLLGNTYIPLNTFAWMANATPAEKYYQSSIKRFNPGFVTGDAAGLGWTSGALLVAASAKLTDKPTTAQFLEGLYALKGDTLGGLTVPLTFKKGANPVVPYCLFAAISNSDSSGWATAVSTPKCTSTRAPSDPNK